MESALVLRRRCGSVLRLTLNRSRVLNALNIEMFEALSAGLAEAVSGGFSAVVVDGVGERGFCAGGDIKQIAAGRAVEFLECEYRLDYAFAVSPVPVVGFMTGLTMGGGIGVTAHGAHRVVCESSVLAMPETRIGILPDVGATRIFAGAPGRLGDFFALGGYSFDAAGAIELGFADSFVRFECFPALLERLSQGVEPARAIAEFASLPLDSVDAGFSGLRGWWDDLAFRALGPVAGAGCVDDRDAGEVVAALSGLLRVLGESGRGEAREFGVHLSRMCPMALAVTFAQLSRVRAAGLSLAQVLREDRLLCARLTARADFAEGVRAQVIDKDRAPRWRPGSLAGIDRGELGEILAEVHGAGLPFGWPSAG